MCLNEYFEKGYIDDNTRIALYFVRDYGFEIDIHSDNFRNLCSCYACDTFSHLKEILIPDVFKDFDCLLFGKNDFGLYTAFLSRFVFTDLERYTISNKSIYPLL